MVDLHGSIKCDNECKDVPNKPNFSSSPDNPHYAFLCRLIKNGCDDHQGVSWMRFSEGNIDTVHGKIPYSEHDSNAMHKMAKIVFGLCLYLQTQEGNKAMLPCANAPKRQNVTPAEGRLLKKRSHYTIRDMITHTFREAAEHQGGTHMSPRTHWRKLHMRSLRDDRFKRNPDGSVRVIWIRPAIINQNDKEVITDIRKVD
jgi:hypothetical protein